MLGTSCYGECLLVRSSLVPRLLPSFLSHTVQKSMQQKAGEEPGNEARWEGHQVACLREVVHFRGQSSNFSIYLQLRTRTQGSLEVSGSQLNLRGAGGLSFGGRQVDITAGTDITLSTPSNEVVHWADTAHTCQYMLQKFVIIHYRLT